MDANVVSAVAAVASAVATIAAVVAAVVVYQGQRTLAQRQMIVTLWKDMTAVGVIRSDEPDGEKVRRAVNTLELVAICYESQAVDRSVIHRTWGDVYIALYQDLEKHNVALPEVRSMTGAALLRENRAAMSVYDQIKQHVVNQGKVK